MQLTQEAAYVNMAKDTSNKVSQINKPFHKRRNLEQVVAFIETYYFHKCIDLYEDFRRFISYVACILNY